MFRTHADTRGCLSVKTGKKKRKKRRKKTNNNNNNKKKKEKKKERSKTTNKQANKHKQIETTQISRLSVMDQFKSPTTL